MAKEQGQQRILVRSPNWIGDQVMAYPFFSHLRECFPNAHIAVTCVPWVDSIQFRNLVDEVFVMTPPKKSSSQKPSVFHRWRVLEQNANLLKKAGPWNIGITLPNSFSSAWIFYRAGVGFRQGFNADARRFLLNSALPFDVSDVDHRAQSYLKLLPQEYSFDLDLEVMAHFDPAAAWPDANPLAPPQEKYWILAPGATAESRRWSVEKFEALAHEIARSTSLAGVIIGGAAEATLAEKLCKDPHLRLQNWTHRGSVARYWQVFQKAEFSICNDSGLAHVASLCGSRVLIIWGAGHPSRTKPLGPGKVSLVMNPLECWPCERNTCLRPSSQKLECIDGIDVDLVWKEVQSEIQSKVQSKNNS